MSLPAKTHDSILSALHRQATHARRHAQERDWEGMQRSIEILEQLCSAMVEDSVSIHSGDQTTLAGIRAFAAFELADLRNYMAEVQDQLNRDRKGMSEMRKRLRTARNFRSGAKGQLRKLKATA